MIDKVGILDSYHLSEILKKSARKLGERCGLAAVDMFAARLCEHIGTVENDKYSYIWRSAIEDHEQDAYKVESRSILVDAVRDAALGALSNNSNEAMAVARSLLQSPYPTVNRVGIYVCSEHYGTIGEAFWESATANWFIEITYWHELYWFINKSFSRFSVSQRAQFLSFVEEVRGEWRNKSRQEELDERHMRDLLHPAIGLGDPAVDNKFQILVQRWGPVRDHPDFHTYSSSGSVGDKSPISSDALVAMSDVELVQCLKGFVPTPRSLDGPTYRGLASAISAAVRASEDGFAQRIGLFSNLARPYQHGLLRGLKERWSDDTRDIDWPATLALLQTIVTSSTLQTDLSAKPSEGWEPSVRWVISDIADLLKSAIDTERKLPAEFHQSSLRVLQLILEVTSTEIGQTNDAVSHAINSPRGRTLESLIHLALAMRREEVENKSDSGKTWHVIGTIFEKELATSESGLNPDFAAMAGMYCVNFHYLNAEWTEANINRIFSISNKVAWECAAQGFAYQRYLYDWLFKRLSTGGHLRKMVYSVDGLPDQVAERALHFLGLAYLEGLESLDELGLLNELIQDLRVKQLSQLCWFFWTFRGKDSPPTRSSKILTFWLKVAEQIRSRKTDVPELQSALSQLAVFVEELTPDAVQALTEAAPHAQFKHHGYILIENLARLSSQYPKEVAAIFRATISVFLPDYREEDVVTCVNRLAIAGEIEEAEWICNEYAIRGSNLLKETYDSIRAKKITL